MKRAKREGGENETINNHEQQDEKRWKIERRKENK